MRTEGKLTKWNDDRGFGFITPNQGGPDVFIHISEFPRDGDRPSIGERVSFETDFSKDGKPRAVNVRCPDRAPVRRASRKDAREPGRPGLFGKLVPLMLVIAIGAYGYKAFSRYDGSFSAAPEPIATTDTPAAPARFHCDGRTHCSQMTSCEEATFFLRNCPNVKMDGNHDGVPCEMQWCGR
ncbi:MAG: cold-shock protein [Denitromonas halophila]|nr:MAG: cold-shock protein [Denitromonas halophila]